MKDGIDHNSATIRRWENRRTDWFIRKLYQPKGFFTPPYETLASLQQRLEGMYSEAEVSAVEGVGCFRCVK